jgi:hypothetical protein
LRRTEMTDAPGIAWRTHLRLRARRGRIRGCEWERQANSPLCRRGRMFA